MTRKFATALATFLCLNAIHAVHATPNAQADGVTALGSVDFQFCPPNCNITVRVDAIDVAAKTCKGAVVGNPPGTAGAELWLIVPARKLPPNQPVINWALNSSAISGASIAFSTDGVDIVDNNAADFIDKVKTNSTFQWRSANTRLRAASYNIKLTVTPDAGTAYDCTLADPIIINRGN